eukprot:Trichotokara_eunicae@DN3525_c0_g1_i12.p1
MLEINQPDEKEKEEDKENGGRPPVVKKEPKPKAKAKPKPKGKAAATAPKIKKATYVIIQDYRDNSSHDDVMFTIRMSKEMMARAESEGIAKVFKLTKSIPMTNLTLFNADGKVKKYENELEILREFGELRLKKYEERKAYLVRRLEREWLILRNKVRFVEEVIEGTFVIQKKKRDQILAEMNRLGFDKMSTINRTHPEWKLVNEVPDAAGSGGEEEVDAKSKDYEYLLGMNLWSLSEERAIALRKQMEEKKNELEDLQGTSISTLWQRDLSAVEEQLEDQLRNDDESRAENMKFKQVRRASLKAKKGKGAAGNKKAKAKAVKKEYSDGGASDSSSNSEPGSMGSSVWGNLSKAQAKRSAGSNYSSQKDAGSTAASARGTQKSTAAKESSVMSMFSGGIKNEKESKKDPKKKKKKKKKKKSTLR